MHRTQLNEPCFLECLALIKQELKQSLPPYITAQKIIAQDITAQGSIVQDITAQDIIAQMKSQNQVVALKFG